MDRKISLSLVFLLVFSWTVYFASSLTKCCPQQYELSSPNIVGRIAFRSNVDCVKSNGSTLVVSRPANLTIGLPNCTRFRFVEVYDKSSSVDCVDRVSQTNTIFGVRCDDEFSLAFTTFTIPLIRNIRKCCPPNRKYDAKKQFCWNHLAENYSNALVDVLKLGIKGKNAFVNVSYGAPPCRPTDVLFDKLEYYQKLRITQSDAIYDGSGLLLSFDEYCLDVVDDLFEYLVVRSCRDQHSVCGMTKICVRKCCPEGYEVKLGGCQPSTKALSLAFHNGTIALADVRPAILHGESEKCTNGKYLATEEYVLEMDSRIHLPLRNEVIEMDEYCFDTLNDQSGTHLFRCFPKDLPSDTFRSTLITVCEIISVFSLFLTFIIYAILPTLRNAHLRLIMCYLLTSMITYIIMVAQNILGDVMDLKQWPLLCKILGFLMLFSALSSFSWLNIISFDIWSTFRAVESSFFKKPKTCRRFFLFCLYGWGFAAGWSALAIFCQLMTITDSFMSRILKPDIGKTSCWFSKNSLSRIPFFIAPVGVMLAVNVVLFISTVKYCTHIKSELKKSRGHNGNYSMRKYTADMNGFMINIKLFILMGLTWTMELISLSAQLNYPTFFLITDVVNALQGIIIFSLFVLKRKVLHDLKRTVLGECHGQRTRNKNSTFITSTNSSVIQSMMNAKGVSTTA